MLYLKLGSVCSVILLLVHTCIMTMGVRTISLHAFYYANMSLWFLTPYLLPVRTWEKAVRNSTTPCIHLSNCPKQSSSFYKHRNCSMVKSYFNCCFEQGSIPVSWCQSYRDTNPNHIILYLTMRSYWTILGQMGAIFHSLLPPFNCFWICFECAVSLLWQCHICKM